MPELSNLIAFSLIALGMVLTPGPNMIYVISRSISQGRKAGLISLGGVALGFIFYMLCAAFGITGLVMAVPYAYDTLRMAGAVYLLYLAWQAVKPGGRSPFQVKALPQDSNRQLFLMGLMTKLFNPKVAVLAAVHHRRRRHQRTQSVADTGLRADFGEPECECHGRYGGGFHCSFFDAKAWMGGGAALADGYGVVRVCGADGG